MKIYSNPKLSDHVMEQVFLREHMERIRLQNRLYMRHLMHQLFMMAIVLFIALVWQILGN